MNNDETLNKTSTDSNPQKSATALKYDGKSAPTIVAKGHGELAEDIIALAREHGVLIHQDDELNRLLGQLQLGDNIPKELYIVIAELIAFSYVLQGKFPDQWQNIHQRIDLKT
ncbi:EscU/YscU/HrcU family type III secretion system export apparatus switch protein [Arsukibacterium sp.]|uniref:EscU/YscU/HrcU family type III secretion system export apparatus switch protein n=1 Tax=Arsukibacterium sp. TaxID=1977258 RepID=UPI00299D2F5C|nr:EscU/YscU/HrcU family type III secretion system export apparatus switch protein [Arsukibacterium sp.]MDX1538584.1 EscU/YscU/HrcU family type III secretion system export apparatus switch protein [Arsukibacterium sp.]